MKHTLLSGLVATTMIAAPALAQDHSNHDNHNHHAGMEMGSHTDHSIHAAHNHAKSNDPIGVMGSHLHAQGDWMVSYRYMRMEMSDMRDGTSDLSPEEIVGDAARFPNPSGAPAGFRVIPDEMTMQMHMLGGMYGATDWLTLMAMANYIKKDMNHFTFQGLAGTTRLGEFETESSGWGDTSVGGLIKLYETENTSVHLNAMLSIPTGSIKETDDVLAPNGTRPVLRLPYAMQLGSGTYDAMPAVTYTGAKSGWNWGAQYMATIRLEDENDQNYALGDKHAITAWGGTRLTDWLAGTLRLSAETIGDIDGSDALITAPVTTADPDNYGGDFISASVGFNITPPKQLEGAQIGAEFTVPLYQDLNGPQMKRDYGFTLGVTYSF